MNREEREHIIRASADVTDQYDFIIVGSQWILGPVPNPPEEEVAREAPQLSSSTTAPAPSPAVATTPGPASESAGWVGPTRDRARCG
jgi:hypothetical protein